MSAYLLAAFLALWTQEQPPAAPLDITGLEKAIDAVFAERDDTAKWLPPFTYRAPDGKTYAPKRLRRQRDMTSVNPAAVNTQETFEYTLEADVPLAEIAAHYIALLGKRAIAVSNAALVPNFRVNRSYVNADGAETESITWYHAKGMAEVKEPNFASQFALMQSGTLVAAREKERTLLRLQVNDVEKVSKAALKGLLAEIGKLHAPFLALAYPGAKAQGDTEGFVLAAKTRAYLLKPAPRLSEILDWYQKRLLARGPRGRLTRTERLPTGEIPGQGRQPDGSLIYLLPEGLTAAVNVFLQPDGGAQIEVSGTLSRIPPRSLPPPQVVPIQ